MSRDRNPLSFYIFWTVIALTNTAGFLCAYIFFNQLKAHDDKKASGSGGLGVVIIGKIISVVILFICGALQSALVGYLVYTYLNVSYNVAIGLGVVNFSPTFIPTLYAFLTRR